MKFYFTREIRIDVDEWKEVKCDFMDYNDFYGKFFNEYVEDFADVMDYWGDDLIDFAERNEDTYYEFLKPIYEQLVEDEDDCLLID